MFVYNSKIDFGTGSEGFDITSTGTAGLNDASSWRKKSKGG